MNDSILITIKKLLGLEDDDTSFDTDIITHINSFIPVLYQLGVGPSSGLLIEDSSSHWSDLLENEAQLALVKTWLYLRVRKVFDPPQSGTAMEALNSTINELEWRINVSVDPKQD